jgi:AcrR family transcriptional regulator
MRRVNPKSKEWKMKRAALVVAHPGHELRVHGWLCRAKPLAFVLTDGSGGASEGRIGSTARLFEAAGVTRGSIFGRFTDKQIYRFIMDGRHELFTGLVDELARELAAAEIEYVAGDAVEGYNPSHDICRMIVGAAIAKIGRETGRVVQNFDFLLVGRPEECPAEMQPDAIHLVLDDAELDRKLAAARGYTELARELEMALERADLDAYRHEWQRPVAISSGHDGFGSQRPFYETYGEKMVAQGRYSDVLRWDQHMRPLADALRRHGEGAAHR